MYSDFSWKDVWKGAGDHRCLNGVVFADCWSWAWNLEDVDSCT